jgi:hypothetical protein
MLLTPPRLRREIAVSNSVSADRADTSRRFCRSLRGGDDSVSPNQQGEGLTLFPSIQGPKQIVCDSP